MGNMKLIDRLLRLRKRQLINDNLKSILHLRSGRFYDLISEIQQLTRPSFDMAQCVWDDWLYKTMPKFMVGSNLLVLGYEIKML